MTQISFPKICTVLNNSLSLKCAEFAPNLLVPLQAGALDLLKELRSIPMTLELLQVHFTARSGFRRRSALTEPLSTVHQNRHVGKRHPQAEHRRGGDRPRQVLNQVLEEAFG